MNQEEAVQALYDSDHAILEVAHAYEIAKALGTPLEKVPVETFRTDPKARNGKGLVMYQEGAGVDAAELSEAIADYHKLSYPQMFGIGSRLRVATGAIKRFIFPETVGK